MTTIDQAPAKKAFDAAAWIAGMPPRPTRTVTLAPPVADFHERLEAVEQMPAEQALGALEALRAEWQASPRQVRVKQLTRTEVVEVARRAERAQVGAADAVLHLLSAACEEPALSVKQLRVMRGSGLAGEAMVNDLLEAVQQLREPATSPSDVEAMYARIAGARSAARQSAEKESHDG